MSSNDDVAGFSDAELVNERDKLKGRLIVLNEMEKNGSISPRLVAEQHDVTDRLNRVDARINQRYQSVAQAR